MKKEEMFKFEITALEKLSVMEHPGYGRWSEWIMWNLGKSS